MKPHFTPLLLIAVLLMPVAFAHEHQIYEINGKIYEFTMGSLNEPVAVDDKTGVDLRINLESEHDEHEEEMAHGTYEVPPNTPIPTAMVTVSEDAKSGHNLHISTTNFKFAPER